MATPDGQFNEFTSPLTPASYIRHHDLNADGHIEIFSRLYSGDTQILRRIEGSTFVPVDTIDGLLPPELEWLDVTSDGTEDLLLGTSTTVGYPLNLRSDLLDDGEFGTSITLFEQPSGNDHKAHLSDLNDDGVVDVLLWSGTNQGNDHHYSVVQGSGNWPLAQELQSILQCDQREHLLQDVDHDGLPDLVIFDEACVLWLKNLSRTTNVPEVLAPIISIHPNPGSSFTMHWNEPALSGSTLQVYDGQGRNTQQIVLGIDPTAVDATTWSSGLYHYCITDRFGAVLQQGKWMRE